MRSDRCGDGTGGRVDRSGGMCSVKDEGCGREKRGGRTGRGGRPERVGSADGTAMRQLWSGRSGGGDRVRRGRRARECAESRRGWRPRNTKGSESTEAPECGGAGAKGGADRLGTEVRREGTSAERTSEGGAAAASGVMGACFVRGWSVGLVPTKKLPETDRFPGAFRAESEI